MVSPTPGKAKSDKQVICLMLQFFLIFYRFAHAIRRGLADPEFRSLCILVLIVIGSGTIFYHSVEGMTWIDAVYFCVITLTTIGYGDLAPKTDIGKLFTIVYIFLGLGLLAAFIGYVAQHARENTQENGVLPRLRRKGKKDGTPSVATPAE